MRLTRVTNYVIKQVKKIFANSITEFLKSFLTSVVDIIVGRFTGMIKKAWLIVKQGFSSLIEAIKLIVSPPKNMSKAQIADAVVKIISVAVINIAGLAFETWLNTLGIPDLWSNVIYAILSGFSVVFVTYLLDQIDLFDVRRELRMARVEEVFTMRIDEIRHNTEAFNKAALQRLAEQRIQFGSIMKEIYSGFEDNNPEVMANGMFEMAGFMDVDVEYSNVEEFADFLDDNDGIDF
ncbi:MAG: hypothetical protein KAX49_18660 [Halanaerobiales bacterium]|nr:hypothetical protein [Halanaerobiales bacterium]